MTIRSALGAGTRPARALLGLALVLGISAGTTSTSAAAETKSPQQQPPANLNYVAMGDSFAAGMADILDLASGPCAQGRVSYPKIVAQNLQAQLTDMSCNGGTLAAMGLQLQAVPADAQLITITTGMNDLPWADLVVGCGFPGLVPVGLVAPEVGACSLGDEILGGNGLKTRMDAFHQNLGAFLDALQVQAPRARIYLVGYPKVVPPPEEHCWPFLPVTGKDLQFYEDVLTAANKVMIEYAKDTAYPRVGYVDTHYGSRGHDVCKQDAWINQWFAFSYGQAPLHPNEKGYRAMADEVLRALGLTKS